MSESVKINPVSPRTFELLGMETIESQFPVAFDDGGGFPMFTAYCAQCSRPIENQHLRGRVTRSRKDLYTIEAAGACFACNIATPVSYRLHQDGTMTGISPDSGKWTEWNKKPGFFQGIWHTLFPDRI
jgi:hypothetical protein